MSKVEPFTRGVPRDSWSDPYNPFNSMKYLMWRENLEAIVRGEFLPPYMVDVDVSNRCNFNCGWCNSRGIRNKHPDMLSEKHLLRLADFLKYWGVKSACFTGNTKIKLVNGKNKTLKQLTTEWNKNKTPFEIYSRDKKGNIIPSGTLEDLCLSTIQDQSVLECVESFLDCCKEKGSDVRRPHKSKLHAYLASNDKFVGLKIGEASKAGAWNWNHQRLKPFKKLLCAL